MIEGNTSEKESESAATAPPAMDDEMYAFVQEMFQLARRRRRTSERISRNRTGAEHPRRQGNSLLMLTSYNGNYEAARVLLERGGDSELANDASQIPLAGSAFKGDAEMARLLIEHGATLTPGCLTGKRR